MLDKLLDSKPLKRFLVLFTLISALCLVLSLLYPVTRKAQAVNEIGDRSLSAMTSLSLALTYYSDDQISQLAQKDSCGFHRVYLLSKGVGGKIYAVLDSGYRDNAREGVDYTGPATQYKPLSSKAKSAIDRVFSRKEPRITAGGIAETADGVKVVCSYVPVYNRSGEIIAVLGVDCGLSAGMVFDRVGFVDLNWMAGVSALFTIGGVLLLYGWIRLLRRRKQQNASQSQPPEDSSAPALEDSQKALPEPSEPDSSLPPSPDEKDENGSSSL